MEQLAERLKALGERATKGEWATRRAKASGDVAIVTLSERCDDGQPPIVAEICEDIRDRVEHNATEAAANAALIISLRNALPELLAALEDQALYRWLVEHANLSLGGTLGQPRIEIDSWAIDSRGITGIAELDKAINCARLGDAVRAARPTACATDGGEVRE